MTGHLDTLTSRLALIAKRVVRDRGNRIIIKSHMDRIGRYEVKGELGRGGFGVVLRAYDPLMRRNVAIKVLFASDMASLGRFRSEAGVNLQHKNIVTVFDFVDSGRQPYLVMELLSGEPLQKKIEMRAPLSMLDRASILYQIADGLKYAHARRIIHRDIKPANVIVLPNGDVKILDFGIALFADQATRYTATGYMVGSVAYMAPDLHEHGEAGQSTDVFAFGVTAYELLTGANPFAGKTLAQCIHLVMTLHPAPVRQVQPSCPIALDQLIHKAIAKEPEQRYASFGDLLLDLAPILASLRATWAKQVCAEVSERMAKGDLDTADVALRGLLEIDPAHGDGQALRAEIQRRRDRAAGMGRTRPQPPPIVEPPEVGAQATPRTGIPAEETHPKVEISARLRRWLWIAGVAGSLLIGSLGYWDREKSNEGQTGKKREPPKKEVLTRPQSPAPQMDVKTKVNSKDGLTYVWLEPGTFMMGCSPGDGGCDKSVELPAHEVTLSKGFWIGQTEVTQESYEKVIGANPSMFKGAKLPVANVSWKEAKIYCEKVSMRLPTEAEWEYAARGGDTTSRYGPLDAVAWVLGDGSIDRGDTHEVGQKKPNRLRLYDMLGNVWEWVADWYGPYADKAVADPMGPRSGEYRIVRGGSGGSGTNLARVSCRYRSLGGGDYDNGIRCVGE